MYYSSQNIPQQSFGGKANGLVSLSREGFRVPDFYIVPNNTIQEIILGTNSIESLCNQWITDNNPEVESLWSVRSSADVEDGENQSYAGLFTTVINTKPHELESAFETVINGFKQVQESLTEYHQTQDFGFHIVLQKMIGGEISGVGFSVNPLDQFNENPVINIIPGLGIKLVSGEEDAMMIDLSSTPTILTDDENYFGEVYKSNGIYERISVSSEALFEEVKPHLKELKESLQKIDQFYGYPVDTEFTIYKDQIYWLQVRPITNLIPRGDYMVWDNSNMDVNYPGTVMPLTISFVQYSYSNAYMNMCRFLGARSSFIDKNKSLFKNTIGAIKGGMYYNITAYQQILYQLPFGKKVSKLFPKMLGAEDAKFQKPSQSASFLVYARLFLNLIRSMLFFGRYKKRYVEQYNRVQDEFTKTSLKELSHQELIAYYKNLESELSNFWYVPILNSLFTMTTYNRLNKTISKSKLNNDYPNFLNDSLMGSGQVVSMELVRSLQNLIYQLHQNSEVKRVILEMESSLVLPYLELHHTVFYNMIIRYIQKYGERSDEGELKIETINYREDPSKFISFLQSNLQVPQLEIKSKEKMDFVSVLKQVYKNNPVKSFLFKKAIQFNINRVRDRENFRFIRTKTFDMVRQIFREMDRKLLADETIANANDSLYLYFDELILPEAYFSNYKALISDRKSTYQNYRDVEHPIRYHEVNNELYPIEEKSTAAKGELDGVACSSGVCEGEVLLVTAKNIHELEISGKILVAPFFEPGWVGLFSRAEGIISERGSLLSHTSILCREMGIPAIISAKKITKLLNNGDIIKMDGATGSIEKIDVA